MLDIKSIQEMVAKENADAWVMFDYENKNATVAAMLGHKMLTRKIVLVIPAFEKPFVIAHFIDTVFLKDKEVLDNFQIRPYATWQEMEKIEAESIKNYKTVLLDISEDGLLPRVSLADYGSTKFVEKYVRNIKSSADIMQNITAKLSEKQLDLQRISCQKALKIKDEAFKKIRDDVLANGQSDEYEIQQFICHRFHEEGMVYDEAPIVAIGPNASNPHYGPSENEHSPIRKDDLVLIDMWAKEDDPDGVYADITWMGYVGKSVPAIYKERFDIVKSARDGVIEFLKEQLPLRPVCAFEADDVARDIITKKGYGPYFKHRVGHNIAVDVSPHGPGANLDNYETHDTRHLIAGTSFSDEPGIYAQDFGVRSETDLHNDNGNLLVLGGLQEEIIPILSIAD